MAEAKKEKKGHAKAQHDKAHGGKGSAKHAQEKKEGRAGHAGHEAKQGRAGSHTVHKHETGHVKADAEKAHAKSEAAKKVVEKKTVVKISKSKEVKRLSRLVRAKARPMFRGRFGQRAVRNVSDKKWQRWRKPRGIDIYFRREDGLVPGTGYQRPKEIRFVHPSGYREMLVCNMHQLLALDGEKARVAARISGKLGKRKKELLLKKADELKVFVLNR